MFRSPYTAQPKPAGSLIHTLDKIVGLTNNVGVSERGGNKVKETGLQPLLNQTVANHQAHEDPR